MDIDMIKTYEQMILQGEYHYRLTGNYEELNNAKYLFGKYFADNNTKNLISECDKNQYHDYMKYLGNQELLCEIYNMEADFKQHRKKLMKTEYELQLRKLVKLRNEFAKSAGFHNYLDFRYHLFGVDTEILHNKITKEYKNELDIKSKIDINQDQLFIDINNNVIFNKESQIQLIQKTLESMGIYQKSNETIYHFDNLPEFYIGAVVPLQIPEEIHVFINKVSGLSGLSVFMHEIGHAYYYNNINKDLA